MHLGSAETALFSLSHSLSWKQTRVCKNVGIHRIDVIKKLPKTRFLEKNPKYYFSFLILRCSMFDRKSLNKVTFFQRQYDDFFIACFVSCFCEIFCTHLIKKLLQFRIDHKNPAIFVYGWISRCQILQPKFQNNNFFKKNFK